MVIRICLFLLLEFLNISTGHAQTRVADTLNLELFHQLMIKEINSIRVEKGCDTLSPSDQLGKVAGIEAKYCSGAGKSVSDPNFITNTEGVLGERVHSSASTNLVAHWNTKRFDSWNRIEERMVEGYILNVEEDGMTRSLLNNHNSSDPCYRGYIGVNSVVEKEVVFTSIVIYFTCSALD